MYTYKEIIDVFKCLLGRTISIIAFSYNVEHGKLQTSPVCIYFGRQTDNFFTF